MTKWNFSENPKADTFTVTMPLEVARALGHLLSDLGLQNSILRYDERLFDKWAAPRKGTRERFQRLAEGLPGDYDWDDHFEQLDRPTFPKEAIR